MADYEGNGRMKLRNNNKIIYRATIFTLLSHTKHSYAVNKPSPLEKKSSNLHKSMVISKSCNYDKHNVPIKHSFVK